MDTDRIIGLAKHYLVLLILVVVVLSAIRAAVGEVGFWIEFGIVLIIAFAYRPIVMRLGIGPSSWE